MLQSKIKKTLAKSGKQNAFHWIWLSFVHFSVVCSNEIPFYWIKFKFLPKIIFQTKKTQRIGYFIFKTVDFMLFEAQRTLLFRFFGNFHLAILPDCLLPLELKNIFINFRSMCCCCFHVFLCCFEKLIFLFNKLIAKCRADATLMYKRWFLIYATMHVRCQPESKTATL